MIVEYDYQTEAREAIASFKGNPLCVVPTGGGKSVIIAKHIEHSRADKILMLAHVKELIEQNYAELKGIAPDIDAGIYCAGLGHKDTKQRVICASIQSIARAAHLLGSVDELIIDEAHKVNPKQMGQYRELYAELRSVNPDLRVIGLTATPYRTGYGLIHEGSDTLFDGISYEITIKELIDRGRLVRPISRQGAKIADMTGVKRNKDDYNQTQMIAAFGRDGIIKQAVADMIKVSGDRKSILIFCASKPHAEQVQAELVARGVTSTAIVFGDTHSIDRDAAVQGIKDGSVTHLINVGVYTTGFNARNIDCVVLLRSTLSLSLYVQMLGRGLRTMPDGSKDNCLVLDYGGNVVRHGPLNSLNVSSGAAGEGGKAPASDAIKAKPCEGCNILIGVRVVTCPECGHVHPQELNIDTVASDAEILDDTKPEWRKVYGVKYTRQNSNKGHPDCLRVEYNLSQFKFGGGKRTFPQTVSEYLHFDKYGNPKFMTEHWSKFRGVDYMLDFEGFLNQLWPVPDEVQIKRDGKYWDVSAVRIGDQVKHDSSFSGHEYRCKFTMEQLEDAIVDAKKKGLSFKSKKDLGAHIGELFQITPMSPCRALDYRGIDDLIESGLLFGHGRGVNALKVSDDELKAAVIRTLGSQGDMVCGMTNFSRLVCANLAQNGIQVGWPAVNHRLFIGNKIACQWHDEGVICMERISKKKTRYSLPATAAKHG